MAISITPKSFERPKTALEGPPPLLFASALVFLLGAAIAFGILFSIERNAENKRDELGKEIRQLKVDRRNLQEEVKQSRRLDTQLSFLTELIAQHRRGGNAFRIIETRTHKRVFIRSVLVDYAQNSIKLAAVANDMQSAAEQVYLLANDPQAFEKVAGEGFQLSQDGRISFDIKATVRPELFTLNEMELREQL